MKTLINKSIKSLQQIGILTITLTIALGANFAYGQWTSPTESPVGQNIALPIHTGPVNQTMFGSLQVTNRLTVAGNRPFITIAETETGNNSYRFLLNSAGSLFLQHSSDGDVSQTNVMRFNSSANSVDSQEYVQFSRQTRSPSYCDMRGNNCLYPGNPEFELTENNYGYSRMRIKDDIPVGNDMSSRSFPDLPINLPSKVTFYTATQDNADYICRSEYDMQKGYWWRTERPANPGWEGGNIAIATYNPNVQGSTEMLCDTGTDCVQEGYTIGHSLICYDYNAFENFDPLNSQQSQSWYQAPRNNPSCSQVCSDLGLESRPDPAYNGSVCASGESRISDSRISYTHGTWGSGIANATYETGNMCYSQNSKQDGDGTDITVACHCL